MYDMKRKRVCQADFKCLLVYVCVYLLGHEICMLAISLSSKISCKCALYIFHDVATGIYLTTYFDEINQNTSFNQLIYDRYRIFYMNGI